MKRQRPTGRGKHGARCRYARKCDQAAMVTHGPTYIVWASAYCCCNDLRSSLTWTQVQASALEKCDRSSDCGDSSTTAAAVIHQASTSVLAKCGDRDCCCLTTLIHGVRIYRESKRDYAGRIAWFHNLRL